MKRGLKQRELIRQYLLGTLDEEQHQWFEGQLLSDAGLLEELSLAEDDLAYEYLSGALSEQENAQFESHFLLTPERRRKLEFLGALVDELETLPENDDALPRSWKRFLPGFVNPEGRALQAACLAAVLVILLGGWLLFFSPWQARHMDSPPFVVSLTQDGVRRAGEGEMTRVRIPGGTSAVELQMHVGADDRQAYRAVLLTDEGAAKFTGENLEGRAAQGGKVVSLRVPASILERGDYHLKLSGRSPGGDFQEVGDFYFRVTGN